MDGICCCLKILVHSGSRIPSKNRYFEEAARKIAEDAVRIARHAGRKTVHESDIKLAARR